MKTATRPAETVSEKAFRLTARYLQAFDREQAAWERHNAAFERDRVMLPKSIADEREDRRWARIQVLIGRKDAAELALARFLVRKAGNTSPPNFRRVCEEQLPPAAVASVGGTTVIVMWVDSPRGNGLAIRHTRGPVLTFGGTEGGGL